MTNNNNQKLKEFLKEMSERLINAGVKEWSFDTFYITGEYKDLGVKITSDLICLEFDTTSPSLKDDRYFYFYDDDSNMKITLDYMTITDKKELDEVMWYIENRVKDYK